MYRGDELLGRGFRCFSGVPVWWVWSLVVGGCTGAVEVVEPEPLEEVDLVACIYDAQCPFVFSTGHRGSMLYSPENTLVSIEMGISFGVSVIEVDVKETKDEVLVLMHDSTVNRTTDGEGRLNDMTLEEVRELTALSPVEGVEDQPVPTFREALEIMVGRVLVDVDVKTSRYDLVVADIEAAGAEDWVNVQVGSIADGLAVRALNPSIRVVPDVRTVEEVQAHEESYQPELIEFPWQVVDAAPFEEAALLGMRVTQNALGVTDVAAALRAEREEEICEPFRILWERGVGVLQTDVAPLLVPCLTAHNASLGYTFAGDPNAGNP